MGHTCLSSGSMSSISISHGPCSEGQLNLPSHSMCQKTGSPVPVVRCSAMMPPERKKALPSSTPNRSRQPPSHLVLRSTPRECKSPVSLTHGATTIHTSVNSLPQRRETAARRWLNLGNWESSHEIVCLSPKDTKSKRRVITEHLSSGDFGSKVFTSV